MLRRHRVVFLKPDKGGGGSGIIRVEQTEAGRYEVRYMTKRQTVCGKDTLVSVLKRLFRPGKRYLIQQGIHLARISGRPFDVRVIVQKPSQRWIVMGAVAKVAAKEKIVTNRNSGGIALRVPDVLSDGLGWPDDSIRQTTARLHAVALQTAAVLSERFTGLRVLGLDVGIDERGHLWIIEVNTRPQFHLFRQTDVNRYRRIIRNQRKIIASGRRRQRQA